MGKDSGCFRRRIGAQLHRIRTYNGLPLSSSNVLYTWVIEFHGRDESYAKPGLGDLGSRTKFDMYATNIPVKIIT